MKDIDMLLKKDSEDRRLLKESVIKSALSGEEGQAPVLQVSGKIPDDALEIAKAEAVLREATDPQVDQLVSFLSLLADERRLLRDARNWKSGHKREWAAIYAEAYGDGATQAGSGEGEA